MAWKCTEVVEATLPGIILHLAGNKSHCPGEPVGRGGGREDVTPTTSAVQLVGRVMGGRGRVVISTKSLPMMTVEISDFTSLLERGHDEKSLKKIIRKLKFEV